MSPSKMLGIDNTTGQQTLGDAMWAPLSVVTPARVLGTAFQPNTSKAVLCIYTVQVAAAFSLLAGQTGTIQILSDSSNPPTTARSFTTNSIGGSLTIGLNINTTQAVPIVYLCPAGDFVKIVATGTATLSIQNQIEIVMPFG